MNLKRFFSKKKKTLNSSPLSPFLYRPSRPTSPLSFSPFSARSQQGRRPFSSRARAGRPTGLARLPRQPNRSPLPFLFAQVIDRWGPDVGVTPYLQTACQPPLLQTGGARARTVLSLDYCCSEENNGVEFYDDYDEY
jgi:hypothetical protein